jgi:Ca2+-binding RTX toxin-like protein
VAAAQSSTCFGANATITGSGFLLGTAGNDVIVGSEDFDLIDGLGGDDRICSLGGDDIVRGGLGNDMLDAGAGSDLLLGDVRSVSGDVSSDGGHDVLLAGPGDDVATGDHGAPFDEVTGPGGNDRIDGGPGFDFLTGDHSAAIVSGPGGNDLLDTGTDDSGDPAFLGEAVIGDSFASQSLSGAGGNDSIRARETSRRLVGDHAGAADTNPTNSASGGSDLILGGTQNDTAIVGDHLSGNNPTGASGNDMLLGNEGDDGLHGDSWNPLSGLDFPGAGSDRCDGGPGTDTASSCETVVNVP